MDYQAEAEKIVDWMGFPSSENRQGIVNAIRYALEWSVFQSGECTDEDWITSAARGDAHNN